MRNFSLELSLICIFFELLRHSRYHRASGPNFRRNQFLPHRSAQSFLIGYGWFRFCKVELLPKVGNTVPLEECWCSQEDHIVPSGAFVGHILVFEEGGFPGECLSKFFLSKRSKGAVDQRNLGALLQTTLYFSGSLTCFSSCLPLSCFCRFYMMATAYKGFSYLLPITPGVSEYF